MYKRALSQQMFDDLKNANGKLHPLLERVLKDDTLSLEFRGEGFSDVETNVSYKEGANVYYRGGSLFFIEKKTDDYILRFNTKYCKDTGIELSMTPSLDYTIKNVSMYKKRWTLGLRIILSTSENSNKLWLGKITDTIKFLTPPITI